MVDQKVKILIVEDNSVVAEDLSQTLRNFGYHIVATTDNGFDAVTMLEKHEPDIALLDIHLKGDLTGIELAKIINEKFNLPFIYLTAYADGGTFDEAVVTKPNAYILKPINQVELHHAIELALFRFSDGLSDAPESNERQQDFLIKEAIFIKENDHFIKVLLENVQFIEASGSYSKVYCGKRTFTIANNLSKLHLKLEEHGFVRIHRSFVVNLSQVTGIYNDHIEITDIRIPVSYTYKKMLMDRLKLV